MKKYNIKDFDDTYMPARFLAGSEVTLFENEDKSEKNILFEKPREVEEPKIEKSNQDGCIFGILFLLLAALSICVVFIAILDSIIS
jgi:hypothetical protein